MKKLKYAYRVRIAKDIIAEVMPPARVSNRAIILCGGLPSIPAKRGLIDFLNKKGFWVFHPRYRGTWESEGQFLKKSPVDDVIDVARAIRKGVIKEEFGLQKIRFKIKNIYIIGSSFGGAVALCAARDKRIVKVIALSPVVDFRNIEGEDGSWLGLFIHRAFGSAYRFSGKDWKRLDSGTLFNPVDQVKKKDNKKVFIMHSKDDEVVGIIPVRIFVQTLGCKYREFKTKRHMPMDAVTNGKVWKEVRRFLSSRT